jgi:6-phosphogluconolactonase
LLKSVPARHLCLSFLVLLICPLLPASGVKAQGQAKPTSQYLVYFGTSTGPESKGIYACSFDPSAERFGPIALVAEVEMAAWLTLHPKNRILYAVSELGNDGKTEGEILSFAIDSAVGSLKPLNRISSGGGGPTHLAVDKTGKPIVVANYGGSRVTAFRLNSDGSLGDRTGKYLLAANQDSSNMTIFKINGSTGELSSTGKVLSVPTPVCIVFVPADPN